MFAAFGGHNNVVAVQARGSRLLLTSADRSRVDLARLQQLFPRGVVPGESDIHLLIGTNAPELAEALMRQRVVT
jgi:phosphotransferase system IIB component